MSTLVTPFGRVQITIGGKEIQYTAVEGKKMEYLCPEVVGRYQIKVEFEPDGQEHEIACVLPEMGQVNKGPESGENLELQSFYNSERWKISIGCECEAGYYEDGTRVSSQYDYDVDYLDAGMSYLILKETKTSEFTFGIAWIDDVGWDDDIDDEHDRDVQTWFAADPTLSL